jgi:hypothetical protein
MHIYALFGSRLFDLHVDFFIKSREPEPGADGKGGAKGAGKAAPAAKPTSPKPGSKDDKGGKKPGLALDGVFVLSPVSLDLKIDETQEVTVYAFPTEVSIPLTLSAEICIGDWKPKMCSCNMACNSHS